MLARFNAALSAAAGCIRQQAAREPEAAPARLPRAHSRASASAGRARIGGKRGRRVRVGDTGEGRFRSPLPV